MRASLLLVLLAGCASFGATEPAGNHPLASTRPRAACDAMPATAAAPSDRSSRAELRRLREQNEKLSQELAETRRRADSLAATVEALKGIEQGLSQRR